MSEIIDFSSRFTADYIAWCQKHPDISSDDEKMEDIFPKQYEKWYTSPKKWLNGKTPIEYFEEINDAQIYASMFVSYIEMEMDVPEPLIDCMINMKRDIFPILRNILFVDASDEISNDALSNVRAKIVSLIDEMQLEHPYGRYISLLIDKAQPDDDLTETLCLALEETDKPVEVRKALLDVYPMCDGTAKECVLDLLCGFDDNDGTVCSILIEEFKRDDISLGYTAELAGKLGDERLLPYLKNAFDDISNDYMTYTSLKYAIERITGDELENKDFTGDPDYDLLTHIADEEIE